MRRVLVVVLASAIMLACASALAQTIGMPKVSIGIDQAKSPQDVSVSLQILFLLTILSLAPALLIMVTSFTRIVIVLSFVRTALGTQQVPPNTVIIGLALFLTFFTMAPALKQVNDKAVQPYLQKRINYDRALAEAEAPIRAFMLRQTRGKDIALFRKMAKVPGTVTRRNTPIFALIPAFIISELKTAFMMGFMIYVPFLIIDLFVSTTLMSMGMMMLPPAFISLPMKLMLFVLVDGWHLVVRALVQSFA